jgi:hypothetical protein
MGVMAHTGRYGALSATVEGAEAVAIQARPACSGTMCDAMGSQVEELFGSWADAVQ